MVLSCVKLPGLPSNTQILKAKEPGSKANLVAQESLQPWVVKSSLWSKSHQDNVTECFPFIHKASTQGRSGSSLVYAYNECESDDIL